MKSDTVSTFSPSICHEVIGPDAMIFIFCMLSFKEERGISGFIYMSKKWQKVKSLSHVRLFATPWTVAYQASPSMGFSRQEYWSELPFPSPGDLPDLGIEPGSPALYADALTSEPQLIKIHHFADKGLYSQSYGFSSSHIQMWELDHKKGWVLNWCFQTVVLGKTLKSPDSKIKWVNLKGNQPWIFLGKTDAEAEAVILWPPDEKNWFIGKDPDTGQNWRQEKKGITEDEMVG